MYITAFSGPSCLALFQPQLVPPKTKNNSRLIGGNRTTPHACIIVFMQNISIAPDKV